MNTKGSIRFPLVISILIFLVAGLSAYRFSQPKDLGRIVYNYQTWPGVLPYLIANDEGFFEAEGLDVKMESVDSYIQELDNITSGKADFSGDLVLIDVIKRVSMGDKLNIVLATDYSSGADGIVAQKNIKTIGELKGKKVAVEKGTFGEYLLLEALRRNDLSLSDVIEIDMTAQESAQAFIRGEVDAAVTYEPDFSEAVEKGHGWRIFTSADSPGLITDVLVVRNDFTKRYPDKVGAIARAYIKATDFISSNPNKAYAVGAKYFKVTAEEFKKQYAGVKQIGLNENIRLLDYGEGQDSLHGSVRQTSFFLMDQGLIKNIVDSTEIITPEFVREIAK